MATKSHEVFDLLEYAGKQMEGKVEYWDALFDNQSSCSISKDNVDERITMPELTGIQLRSYKNGIWRSASTFKMEKSRLKELTRHLTKSTQKATKKAVRLNQLKPSKLNVTLPVKKSPADVSLESKVENVRNFHKAALNLDKRIINVQVRYLDSRIERIFVNSEGSSMRQVVTRTRLLIFPIARENSNIRMDFANLGGAEGYEVVEECDFNVVAKKTVESSVELLKAKPPPSGEFPVIVDSHVAGMIAHESFGHGLEADQVIRQRSYLAGLIGKQVASESTTILDSSLVAGGHGSYAFDDEGIPAKENVLVQNGILKQFLTDRFSASALQCENTASSRVESYLTKHFVRMSNTYFAAGDMTLEELLEPIKKGVMMVNSNFGMEDPLGGGIQCTSTKGYMIEHGKTSTPLTEVSLSGSVLEVLKSIDGVGKKLEFSVGSCGKGSEDYVPVGDGGPYLRIQKAVVSGG
jgi:TldD protein